MDRNSDEDMVIRVPPMRSFALTAQELGYTPYPITWMYAKEGLRTGMVKGIMGGGAEGYEGLGQLAKYYLAVRDHFEYWFIYMNLDLWNGLPEEHQKIIISAAREMEERRYEVAKAAEIESINRLKEQGIRIIQFNDDQITRIQKMIQKRVWPILRKDIGEDFDQLISSIQQHEKGAAK
jgi:TRAP-type C4-dicarboxylate transport system substrate-binding protein